VLACLLAVVLGCSGKKPSGADSASADNPNEPDYLKQKGDPLDRSVARNARSVATARQAGTSTVPSAPSPGAESGPKVNVPSDAAAVDPASLDTQPENAANPGLRIALTGGREIVLELFADKAPHSTEHVINIAKTGFFDGLYFHRADDMCIQGGDGALVKGHKVWTENLKLEISGVPFIEGSVGLARTAERDSATSQFFICKRAASSLNEGYANIGRTLKGMDIVKGLPQRELGAAAPAEALPDVYKMESIKVVRFKAAEGAS
jgi:peptidylprolyl isomerase